MTWTLTNNGKDSGGDKELSPGQLLLLKSTMMSSNDARYFIFLGAAGRFIKLRQVRFDKKKIVETKTTITVLSSQLNEFAKVLNLVAERG